MSPLNRPYFVRSCSVVRHPDQRRERLHHLAEQPGVCARAIAVIQELLLPMHEPIRIVQRIRRRQSLGVSPVNFLNAAAKAACDE